MITSPDVHITIHGEGPRAVFVHRSTTWGSAAFARQLPPAATHRLEIVDRRGYGRGPDIEHSNAAQDALDLLDVLAAARAPGAVRSLLSNSGRL